MVPVTTVPPIYSKYLSKKDWEFIKENFISKGIITEKQVLRVLELLSKGKNEEASKILVKAPEDLRWPFSDFFVPIGDDRFTLHTPNATNFMRLYEHESGKQEAAAAKRKLQDLFTKGTYGFINKRILERFGISHLEFLTAFLDFNRGKSRKLEVNVSPGGQMSFYVDVGKHIKRNSSGKYYIEDSGKRVIRQDIIFKSRSAKRTESIFSVADAAFAKVDELTVPALESDSNMRLFLKERLEGIDLSIKSLELSYKDEKAIQRIIKLISKGKYLEARKIYKRLAGTKQGLYQIPKKYFTKRFLSSEENRLILTANLYNLLPKIPKKEGQVFINWLKRAKELYLSYQATSDQELLKRLQFFESTYPIYYNLLGLSQGFRYNWVRTSELLSKSDNKNVREYFESVDRAHKEILHHLGFLSDVVSYSLSPDYPIENLLRHRPTLAHSLRYLSTTLPKAKEMASLVSFLYSLTEYERQLSVFDDSKSKEILQEISAFKQEVLSLLSHFNEFGKLKDHEAAQLLVDSEVALESHILLSKKVSQHLRKKRSGVPKPGELLASISLTSEQAAQDNLAFLEDLISVAEGLPLFSLRRRYLGERAEIFRNLSKYGTKSKAFMRQVLKKNQAIMQERFGLLQDQLSILGISFKDEQKLLRIIALVQQGKGSEAKRIFDTLEGKYAIPARYFTNKYLSSKFKQGLVVDQLKRYLPWSLARDLISETGGRKTADPKETFEFLNLFSLLAKKDKGFVEQLRALKLPELKELEDLRSEVISAFRKRKYSQSKALMEKLLLSWLSLNTNNYAFIEPMNNVFESYQRAEVGERMFRYLLNSGAAREIESEAQHLKITTFPALFKYLKSHGQAGVRHDKISVGGHTIDLVVPIGSTTKEEVIGMIRSALEDVGFFKDPKFEHLLERKNRKLLKQFLSFVQSIRGQSKGARQFFPLKSLKTGSEVTPLKSYKTGIEIRLVDSKIHHLESTRELVYEYDPETQMQFIRAWKASQSHLRQPPATPARTEWSGGDFFVFNPYQPQRDVYYELFLGNLESAFGGKLSPTEKMRRLAKLRNEFDPSADVISTESGVQFSSESTVGTKLAKIFQAYEMLRVSGADQYHDFDYYSGKMVYRSYDHTQRVVKPKALEYLKGLLGEKGFEEFSTYDLETQSTIASAIYQLQNSEMDLNLLEMFMDVLQTEAKKQGVTLFYLVYYSEKALEPESQRLVREKLERFGFETRKPDSTEHYMNLRSRLLKLKETIIKRRKYLVKSIKEGKDPRRILRFIDRRIANVDKREEPMDGSLVLDNYSWYKSLVFNYIHEETIGQRINNAAVKRLMEMKWHEYLRKWISDNVIPIIAGSAVVGGAIGSFGGPGGTVAGAKFGAAVGSGLVALCGLSFVVEGVARDIILEFEDDPETFEEYLDYAWEKQKARSYIYRGLIDMTVGRFGASAALKDIGKRALSKKILSHTLKSAKVFQYVVNTSLVLGASYRLSYTLPEAISGEGSWVDVITTVPFFVIGAGGILKAKDLAQSLAIGEATAAEGLAAKGFGRVLTTLSEAPQWLMQPHGLGLNLGFSLMFNSEAHNLWSEGKYLDALGSISKGWKETTGEFIAFDVYVFGPFRLLKPLGIKFQAKLLPKFLSQDTRALAYLIEGKGFAREVAQSLGHSLEKLTPKQIGALHNLLYAGEKLTEANVRRILGTSFKSLSKDQVAACIKTYEALIAEAKVVAAGAVPEGALKSFGRLRALLRRSPKPFKFKYRKFAYRLKSRFPKMPWFKGSKGSTYMKLVQERGAMLERELFADLAGLSAARRSEAMLQLLSRGEVLDAAFIKRVFRGLGRDLSDAQASRFLRPFQDSWAFSKAATGFTREVTPFLASTLKWRGAKSLLFLGEFYGIVKFASLMHGMEESFLEGKKREYLSNLAKLMRSQGIEAEDAIDLAFGYLNRILREMPAEEFYTLYLDHLPESLRKLEKAEALEKIKENFPEISKMVLMSYLYSLIRKAEEKKINPAIAVSIFLFNVLDGGVINIPDSKLLSGAKKVSDFIEKYHKSLGRTKYSFSFEEVCLLWKALQTQKASKLFKLMKSLDSRFTSPKEPGYRQALDAFSHYSTAHVTPEHSPELAMLFLRETEAILEKNGYIERWFKENSVLDVLDDLEVFHELFNSKLLNQLLLDPKVKAFIATINHDSYFKDRTKFLQLVTRPEFTELLVEPGVLDGFLSRDDVKEFLDKKNLPPDLHIRASSLLDLLATDDAQKVLDLGFAEYLLKNKKVKSALNRSINLQNLIENPDLLAEVGLEDRLLKDPKIFKALKSAIFKASVDSEEFREASSQVSKKHSAVALKIWKGEKLSAEEERYFSSLSKNEQKMRLLSILCAIVYTQKPGQHTKRIYSLLTRVHTEKKLSAQTVVPALLKAASRKPVGVLKPTVKELLRVDSDYRNFKLDMVPKFSAP